MRSYAVLTDLEFLKLFRKIKTAFERGKSKSRKLLGPLTVDEAVISVANYDSHHG